MLEPYRVIDLTDELGLLAGQLLADLGADVVQVEPPGGSSAREYGPWLAGKPGRERSLHWWAYARNKRSLVADLDTPEGRDTVVRLAAGADFFLESHAPGALARYGLGYDQLAALNPALVYVSISPFGGTGPKAGWRGSDLTQSAAGGAVFLSGEGDRPPVRVSVPQASAHAAADAAVGALIAHEHRRRTGLGQHVDVSVQQSVTLATMFRSLDAAIEEAPARRVAGGVYLSGAFLQSRFALEDGWVTLGPGFLPSTGHFMRRLCEWMHEAGHCGPELAEEDWGTFALRMITRALPPDAYEPVTEAMDRFFATQTKAELMRAAVERKLLLAPVLSIAEIAESEQLKARGFPTPMHQPGAERPVHYPGPFARFAASPITYRYPAPQVDEHGDALRAEAPRSPTAPRGAAPADTRPLAGVKILDLFWILAGPGATRMLADYGATVVHVESTRKLDTLRVIPPYQFNNPHPEGAGGFQCANANKLCMTLDLTSEEGREVVLELAAWADVVTESFAPGVIDGYGLGWEILRNVNADLIMISSCLMGQSGPWRDFTGFGNLAASVTGFQLLAGWPHRPPSGPYGAYTDFIAVRYNALAILAALEHRARTGQGQYIDQSQAESALHFLAPALLDYDVNDRLPEALANRDADHRAHGVYRCVGNEQWIAIAARTDGEWRALCEAMGRAELADTALAPDAIDVAIEDWTEGQEAAPLAARLQELGIPAHPVLDTPGLFACPQLHHREHFVEIGHSLYQTTTIESARLQLSEAAARRPETAVHFGRDNREVLEDILGYTPERIAGLADRGVLL